jgi:hypothetical protein
MSSARVAILAVIVCLTSCSSDEPESSPDGSADAASADRTPDDRTPDTVACVQAGSNCAGGQTCCAGLRCCSGVPIQPGQDRCEQFCPMAFAGPNAGAADLRLSDHKRSSCLRPSRPLALP